MRPYPILRWYLTMEINCVWHADVDRWIASDQIQIEEVVLPRRVWLGRILLREFAWLWVERPRK